MSVFSEDRVWQLVAVGSAAAAGVAVRSLLQRGWQRYGGEEPPDNPAAPSVDWKDALIWSAGVGAAVGLARMLGERSAAAGWKKIRGGYPSAMG